MAEKPILFSGAMVRAVIKGSKTQTRRVSNLDEINADPDAWHFCGLNGFGNAVFTKDEISYFEVKNPYGDKGDRLWVRETWQYYGGDEYIYQKSRQSVAYKATWESDKLDWQDSTSEPHALDYWPEKWRPSIFMPRWASRLTLEITEVRVERVQDISFDDCLAEGVICTEHWNKVKGADIERYSKEHPKEWTVDESISQSWIDYTQLAFHGLWDSINSKRGFGWEKNPWVWAISFRKVEAHAH